MTTHATFTGRLVMLGFGSISQGVLPLILRHIGMPRANIRIIAADDRGAAIAAEYGIAHEVLPITPENYRAVLGGIDGNAPGARRLAANALVLAAVIQRDLDRHVHVLGVGRNVGIELQRDFAEQRFHVGGEAPLIGEGLDTDCAVKQCRSGRVLNAELAFETDARLRTVGIEDFRRDDAHSFNL